MQRFSFIVFLSMVAVLITSGFLCADESRVCLTCHTKKKSGRFLHQALKKGCIICHTHHHSKEPTEFPKGLKAGEPDLCWECHDKKLFNTKHPHAPVAVVRCTFCHAAHSSDSPKLLLKTKPLVCFSCHNENKFDNKVVHAPLSGGSCDGCHSLTHRSEARKLLTDDIPALCFKCHDKASFTGNNVHAPVRSGLCTFCHSPHATGNPYLLKKPVNDGCLDCHPQVSASGSGTAQKKLSFHGKINHPLKGGNDPLRKDRELSCTSCHNPHVSEWIRLFKYSAEKPLDICAHCHKEMAK